ncbi:MAG TPA: (Fe-S)-binding protein [Spirochaetota bacterium]|nr:(Fe-S)-binding protein [Spirochaetota bacterium]HPI90285.1 (Fe-S)-binding protein [Spirochaetota bacterium]HPR46377.1 (Fe-S)-binding protein [Spirochaetota bacterium]
MDNNKITELRRLMKSRLNRPMRYYLDLCTRCGLCYDTCHVYYGIPKKEYSPVGRSEVVRRLFKKYFRPSGKLFPYWGDATGLDDAVMDEVYEAAFSCTGCRRCMVHCPFGIDIPHILSMAKLLLIGNETAPEELVMLADAAVEKGNSVEFFKDGFKEVIGNLEKEVRQRLGLPLSEGLIPLEKKGARVLYVGLSGAHSIVHPAVVFNKAGENWTLSYFEGVNFGAFVGDPGKMELIAQRVIKEAIELGVEEVVIVECGTAYRIMKFLMGKLPFKVSSIVEVIHRYISEGRIKVKEKVISEPLTYHDPCQLGRNAGVFDEPREVLSLLAADYREMSPTREYNWCCGGGGGLVALDNEEFRIKSGKAKKDQIVATGAKIVVSACENCIMQLGTIQSGYGLDIEVKSLTELVAENLVE